MLSCHWLDQRNPSLPSLKGAFSSRSDPPSDRRARGRPTRWLQLATPLVGCSMMASLATRRVIKCHPFSHWNCCKIQESNPLKWFEQSLPVGRTDTALWASSYSSIGFQEEESNGVSVLEGPPNYFLPQALKSVGTALRKPDTLNQLWKAT